MHINIYAQRDLSREMNILRKRKLTHKKSKIIDAKTPEGKRISVSLDNFLYDFLDLALGEKQTAREFIRDGIKVGAIKDTIDARNEAYMLIIKPSLLEVYNKGMLGQTDIEDFC